MSNSNSAPKLRQTIASGSNPLLLILSILAFLVERGYEGIGNVISSLSHQLAIGDLSVTYDLAVAAVQKALFDGQTGQLVDSDGKAVYIGMHPFKPYTFGIYRQELHDQRAKNAAAEGTVAERRTAREVRKAAKAAEAKTRAEKRAAKALALAEKAQQAANEIVRKHGLKISDVKAEMATTQEAISDLTAVKSNQNSEVAVTA